MTDIKIFNIVFNYIDLDELKTIEIINVLFLALAWRQQDVADYVFDKYTHHNNDGSFNQVKYFWFTLIQVLIRRENNITKNTLCKLFEEFPLWYTYIGSNGLSPFLLATLFNSIRVMDHMLKIYPECRYDRDEEGNTALLLASCFTIKNVITWLLENNLACAKECNDKGYTALMYASIKNNTNEVIELLNSNADINAIDNKGRTALYYAVFTENPEIVKIFAFESTLNTVHLNKMLKYIIVEHKYFSNSNAIDKIIESLKTRLQYPNRVNYRMSPLFITHNTINSSTRTQKKQKEEAVGDALLFM